MNLTRLLGFGLATSFIVSSAQALELEAILSARSDYTSNTARTASEEVGEWILQPGAYVKAAHEGPGVKLAAEYQYFRRIFEEDLFPNENATTGEAELHYEVLPGRLDFDATNVRTETPIRSIAATNPTNRQITGNTQLGPTLRFRARGSDELQVQYLYGERNSDRTSSDSVSHTGIGRYVWVNSPITDTSFEIVWQQIQFENPDSPDIDSTTPQIKHTRKLRNSAINATVGYKQVERSLGRSDVSDVVVDFDLSYRLSGSSSWGLNFVRDIRDQSQVLGFGSEEFGNALYADSDLNELFTLTRIAGRYSTAFGQTQFTIAAFADSEDYEDVQRDVEYLGVRLLTNRKLSRALEASASLQLLNQDNKDQGIEFDQFIFSARLGWMLSEQLSVSAQLRYDDRDPTESQFSTLGYDEWSTSLRLDYRLYP